MMENDGGSDMTFCHLKSNFVERHVEGNDIRINHNVAGSDTNLVCFWQEPID